jgi:DNA-binding response OmpR family regulator
MTNREQARLTALVVDDDWAIRTFLTQLLDDVGFATTSFEAGRPALEALAQRPFDLLLLDQWLPDMNGLQLCEAARERYGAAPLILLITADTRRERLLAALELCADDFLVKPFQTEELLARIDTRLRAY